MVDKVEESVLDLRKVFGLKAVVTTSAASTAGALVEMECTADPGAATMIHFHPHQTEKYEVLDGTLEVFRDGGWTKLRKGETLTIGAGTIHGFRNATDAPVRFRNTHEPALGFQDHLETLNKLVRSGRVKGTRDPRSLMYMSMSAVEHQPDVPVKPPFWVVRTMAFLGRRIGLKLEQ